MTVGVEHEPAGVLIRRAGESPKSVEPFAFALSLESFGLTTGEISGSVALSIPAGWAVEQIGPGSWHLYPIQPDIDRVAYVKLKARLAGGTEVQILRPIAVNLDVQTTFDVARHPAGVRNSASVLGDNDPDPMLLPATYSLMPLPLLQMLFRGLYRDIVYIRSEGAYRGGLCSGMARWAGIRALTGDEEEREWPDIRPEIMTLHGRQLTDRVIGWSAYWFLRGSPKAAYYAVRDDALESGLTKRALDIGVPRPWRRDLLATVVGEGHTVVPFRIRQFGRRRAEIDVYDPNRARESETIDIDLKRNRYAYRNKVGFDDHNVGMLAVPHDAYARSGTAFLAVLGSLLWIVIRRRVRPEGQ